MSTTVQDALGDTVTGYTGTVKFALGVTDSGASGLSNYNFTSTDAGQHVFSVTLTKAVAAGGQSITVTDANTSTITGSQTGMTVAPASVSATNSSVVANPISVPANGSTTSTIIVTLDDVYGNPLSGKTVSLTAGSGSSTITTSPTTTNASGQASFTVKDSTAQSVIYTAKDTTDNVTIGTVSVAFAATGTQSVVIGNSSTGTAGQPSAGDPITITFGSQLNASSMCSTWSSNTFDTLSTMTVTFSKASQGKDDVAFSEPTSSCSSNGNFGSLVLSTHYVNGSSNVVFTGSTVSYSYNSSTGLSTLTITLGTLSSGSVTPNSSATATWSESGIQNVSGGTLNPTSASETAELFAGVSETLLTSNSASPCTSGTSCTTASVTIPNGATALVLAHEGGGGTSNAMSLSGSGFTGSTSPVSSIQFSSKNYLGAFVVTGNGTAHTLTVTYNAVANPVIVDVIQLSNNNTTTPVAQDPTASGTTGSPTSTLTSPIATSGEIVVATALTNTTITTPSGFTAVDTRKDVANGGYVYGVYFDPIAPSTTTTFTASNTNPWGSIALELNGA